MNPPKIPAISDREYLLSCQYRNPDCLNARIQVHKRFSTNHSNWFNWVLTKIDLKPGTRFLEIGCGNGNLWTETQDLIKFEYQGILADLSFGMAEGVKISLSHDDHIKVLVADAQDLPLPSGYFDQIIANNMLYHVPHLDRALGEFKRILKPDGRLCAATNGIGHMQELHDLIRKYFDGFENRDRSEQRFGLENAHELLTHFWENVEVEYYDDNLWVTDTDLLMAYIASMRGAETASDSVLNLIKADINSEIGSKGGFKIHKSTGMVIAW